MSLLLMVATLFHPGGVGPITGGLDQFRPFLASMGLMMTIPGNTGGGGGVPANAYVEEDGTTPYVTETDDFYVTES